ncbi:copper chaperone PCu(A)C [Pigmentiphaga litoralis]|uniref:Copper chaperone PCu(A)C n=1 Tax=Pigmentiphaga litoralis TaxID=516702 RepID=A0A7Y9IV92_9BURK|nr:copper chaperone PCu(A)C [Pigmentiphaga litoralis]NYE22689.1 hypothetical protein [Pigmentiphaga litoralis]NYE83696.1 hypothetical protein [Pigmentiphaga litoralis]
MTLRTFTLTALLLGTLTTSAFAHGYKAGEIDIGHPWARATVPGQPAGGGFLKLDNHGKDDKLLAVRSDVSATAEIHTMETTDNIMRMRQVDGVAVPAGKTVEFAPGGYHIMFMQLKAPLKQGSSFPATLVFEKAGEVKVDFKVEAINFNTQGKAAAGGHQHH